MATSSQTKAAKAVERLRDWLNTGAKPPLYKGKVNRSYICKLLKIPRSTIGSNENLKTIFANIDKEYSSTYRKEKNDFQDMESLVIENLDLRNQLAKAEQEIYRLRYEIKKVNFLINTGKLLP